MFTRVVRRTSTLAATCAAVFALSAANTASAGSKAVPAEVEATYQIAFNGFNIGSFKFRSETDGQSYSLNGDAELSALLGAFKWRGVSRAAGRMSNGRPLPAGYTLAFRGNARSGSIRLGFNDNTVTSASVVPPFPVTSDEVPLRRQHLKDALDPLTAVMALTFGSAENPCGQSLSIFDGKQRFDLALSYRGTRPAGTARKAVVCGVDYRPLGGYRANAQTRELASSNGIEIALLPVPKANIAVPQEIVIPTGYGNVVLSADKVQVKDENKRRIALLDLN